MKLLFLLLPITLIESATLQSVYDAAVSGGGFDKVLELDAATAYTGGLDVIDESIHIIGNGAVIDLEGGSVKVSAALVNVTLRIERCVFINGDPALDISSVDSGVITNNTFYGNTTAIKIYHSSPGMEITNNIIAFNSEFGILRNVGYEPVTSFNNVYQNTGNYIEDCGCPIDPYKVFHPPPQTPNISADPLFTDTAGGDFTLDLQSPCIDAGTPDSVDIGAYEIADIGIENTGLQAMPSICILPNPAKGNFQVSGVSEWTLYDLTGREIKKPAAAGHYLVGFRYQGKVMFRKLVWQP